MKILQIKFGLFSLLAILLASVFLTSCEQDLAQENLIETNTSMSEQGYVLAKGIDLDEKEFELFLENASTSEIKSMSESFKIAHFLIENNRFNEVYDSMNVGDYLSEINLSLFLSDKELNDLNSYSYEESVLSRSYSCSSSGNGCRRCCYWEFPVCWNICISFP